LEKLSIKIRYYANVREATRIDHETITIPRKSSLRKLMQLLSERYPDTLRSYMLDDDGRPINYLSYFINGRNAHTLQGFDTEIKEGDECIIVPSILGG
jgi:MoaD family protein